MEDVEEEVDVGDVEEGVNLAESAVRHSSAREGITQSNTFLSSKIEKDVGIEKEKVEEEQNEEEIEDLEEEENIEDVEGGVHHIESAQHQSSEPLDSAPQTAVLVSAGSAHRLAENETTSVVPSRLNDDYVDDTADNDFQGPAHFADLYEVEDLRNHAPMDTLLTPTSAKNRVHLPGSVVTPAVEIYTDTSMGGGIPIPNANTEPINKPRRFLTLAEKLKRHRHRVSIKTQLTSADAFRHAKDARRKKLARISSRAIRSEDPALQHEAPARQSKASDTMDTESVDPPLPERASPINSLILFPFEGVPELNSHAQKEIAMDETGSYILSDIRDVLVQSPVDDEQPVRESSSEDEPGESIGARLARKRQFPTVELNQRRALFHTAVKDIQRPSVSPFPSVSPPNVMDWKADTNIIPQPAPAAEELVTPVVNRSPSASSSQEPLPPRHPRFIDLLQPSRKRKSTPSRKSSWLDNAVYEPDQTPDSSVRINNGLSQGSSPSQTALVEGPLLNVVSDAMESHTPASNSSAYTASVDQIPQDYNMNDETPFFDNSAPHFNDVQEPAAQEPEDQGPEASAPDMQEPEEARFQEPELREPERQESTSRNLQSQKSVQQEEELRQAAISPNNPPPQGSLPIDLGVPVLNDIWPQSPSQDWLNRRAPRSPETNCLRHRHRPVRRARQVACLIFSRLLMYAQVVYATREALNEATELIQGDIHALGERTGQILSLMQQHIVAQPMQSHPGDTSSVTEPSPPRSRAVPVPRAEETNSLAAKSRDVMASLLGQENSYDELPPPVTQATLAAFERAEVRGPTCEKFVLDYQGGRSSHWNRMALLEFLAKFKEVHPTLCDTKNQVTAITRQYWVRIDSMMKKCRDSHVNNNSRNSRAQRRRNLAEQRRAAASFVADQGRIEEMKPIVNLFDKYGNELVSGDESDHEFPAKERPKHRYKIVRLAWRSEDLTRMSRFLDQVHCANKFNEDGRSKRGSASRNRVPSRLVNKSPPPRGLADEVTAAVAESHRSVTLAATTSTQDGTMSMKLSLTEGMQECGRFGYPYHVY
ncbi:hypothetical protein SISNIDRAFT_471590 [Sistotremastrum niveocremeum HHB9708]|uniref:Uncharacterized protein n=1 Tax=Sistotremastrum niveocremeum HHB9708 TaxID=1314777 RepID=A0A164MFH2_9AGAM|nr:hypothetical protein SISNIDRAFT_471590 [Sistotremastrum niveocremeum HHB9708]